MKPLRTLTAAALALGLFSGALPPPGAGAQGPDAAWSAQSMPELMKFPGLSDAGEDKTAETTPYKAGVKAYLDGNDGEAIARLEEALQAGPADEKAKQLLLKVMLRSINGSYDRGNYKKAHELIRKAYARFPSNPEVKLLHSSMSESKVTRTETAAEPAGLTAAGPKHGANRAEEEPAQSRRAGRRTEGPHAGQDPRTRDAGFAFRPPGSTQTWPPTAIPNSRPAPMAPARELPAVKKADHPAGSRGGLEKAAYLAAISAALLLSATLLSFLYFQRKHEKTLLQRIESLQKALVEAEVRKTEVYRELETRRKAEKQDEELAAIRRAKEERMRLELEKLKAQEEARLLAEIAEKRREAARAAQREFEALKSPRPEPGNAPAPAEGAAPPPPVVPAPPPPPPAARPGGSGIAELLVDVTPPEREAAWGRIADRAAEIYETSPEAAIKFLYDLSRDANPMNRASIVGALASIGAPATLDILFELHKDPGAEVRRETLKHLTRLLRNPAAGIDETYREKIAACLQEEKAKGDWIF